MVSEAAPHATEPDARTSFLIELEDEPGALESVLRHFSAAGVNLTRIESRPARGRTFDFYVDCEGQRGDARLEAVIEQLQRSALKLLILDHREVPWFPREVSDLDVIANETLDAGTDLESDHPGFKDLAYVAQRRRIDERARAYRYGDPLPTVDYTAQEQATWQTVYRRLAGLRARHACKEYLEAFANLERETGFGPDQIPQAQDVSVFLQARTGFRLRPVAGLLSPRHFLNGLAFRTLFSTQYIRHHSKPLYTPEPDVCHELIGHAPMFADPAFAELSQVIGLASLGASDQDVERLARCYWFSVEFGLVRQDDALKAYGAGLLSSFGELAYACEGRDPESGASPSYQPWEPTAAAAQDYPITTYQPKYFVAASLHDAKQRMQRFCEALPRPFLARYDPRGERVWVDRAVRRSD